MFKRRKRKRCRTWKERREQTRKRRQQENDSDGEEDDDEEEDFVNDSSLEIDSKKDEQYRNKRSYVYILQSLSKTDKFYVGWTIDPAKRLREHQGEIKGGAKKTIRHRPWKMIACVTGDPSWLTYSYGQMLEWTVRISAKWKYRAEKSQDRSTKKPKRSASNFYNLENPLPQLRIHGQMGAANRINALFWMFHNRVKWTTRAPTFDHTKHSLTVALSHDFLLLANKYGLGDACQFWNVKLTPLDNAFMGQAKLDQKNHKSN